ncbi:hypothetical protein ZWY2020_001173 [Hordeum vulgare]|nr:hypothetical protein ZWY2020_001173 [Hordeum vulgare]
MAATYSLRSIVRARRLRGASPWPGEQCAVAAAPLPPAPPHPSSSWRSRRGSKGSIRPPDGDKRQDDDEMILWFLKDRKFAVDEAVPSWPRPSVSHTLIQRLQQNYKYKVPKKWRQDFHGRNYQKNRERLYQTGKAYVHDSFDINGRPVLVVVAAKHFPSKQDPLENEKLCAFLVKRLYETSHGTDNILGIFDLRGFGVENGDLQFLKFLIDVFYYYYPKRLGEVLFVDAPFVFQPMWQLVKPLLKQYASLVRFCDAETEKRVSQKKPRFRISASRAPRFLNPELSYC